MRISNFNSPRGRHMSSASYASTMPVSGDSA
jgi:hypothetical protein